MNEMVNDLILLVEGRAGGDILKIDGADRAARKKGGAMRVTKFDDIPAANRIKTPTVTPVRSAKMLPAAAEVIPLSDNDSF